MRENGSDKKRIAILGGGMSALTAAFELTENAPEKDAYDITIYTLGWRLGGKASVGRDALCHDRAYEHGLHIWGGYYDNAFDVVKRVYAGLERGPDEWKSCFTPLNHFTVMEYVDKTWKPWLMEFPANGLEPGIGPMLALAPLPLLVQFLITLENAFDRSELPAYINRGGPPPEIAEFAALELLGRPPVPGEPLLSAARKAAQTLPADPSKIADTQRMALDTLIATGRDQVASAIGAAPDTDEMRRLGIFYDLALTMARGIVADGLFLKGFESADDEDWRKWMKRHCCKPESLESAVVRGCYDYGFIPMGESIGAGTATRLMLRFMLTYKGSVLHALTEPMGDNIIAPFYECLQKRKVKFEFFCRVKALELAPGELAVDRVVLAQQVKLNDPTKEYEPLVNRPDGRASWPSAPKANQIECGGSLEGVDLESAWTNWTDAIPERVLSRRKPNDSADAKDTFDIVILAMGFEGLKTVCADIRKRRPDIWGPFLDTTKTTPTAALQLWLKPDVEALGWPDPDSALTGFERPNDVWRDAPLSTWEDNTRLLDLERPRDGGQPRSLAYLCSDFPEVEPTPPASDSGFPDREWQRAKAVFESWMNDRLGALWPNAVTGTPPQFNWDLLEAPASVKGAARLAHQFIKVNIDPSERYVLSVPGSVQKRLRPDGSGIDNLYLAGDWVRSGVNAGCIEAAVIAGRLTARAITEADMVIPDGENSDLLPLPIAALPLVNVVDKLKSLTAGGLGSIDAFCAMFSLPSNEVGKRLAPGLSLVPLPPSTCEKDRHLVMLIFSRQRRVRPGFLPFGGLNYLEFVELIPNVRRDDLDSPAGGPFSYMPYLLLDQPAAVAVGVNAYGFNKRLARLSAEGGSFVVSGDFGAIRAFFHDPKMPETFDNQSPIDAYRSFLDQPFIAKKSTGEWIYSYLDYRLENAIYQQIDGDVLIGEPFLSENGKGAGKPADIQKMPPWFRFSTQWRLSMPLTSGQLSDTSAPEQIHAALSQWTDGRFRRFLGV